MPAVRDRLPALAALAIPVLAGAEWMAVAAAPVSYIAVNLVTLAVMAAWVLLGRGPHTATSRHILTGIMLVVMLSAIAVGPQVASITGDRVMRWFPLGPLSLHTGMVAVPTLAVLAARNRKLAAPIIVAGTVAAWLQPDAATGFALTFAALGIHHVTKDWRVGLACALGFAASIEMALRGELPPQPFVERALVQALTETPLFGVLLVAGLMASFALLATQVNLNAEKRFALFGALFGFVLMSVMSNYPTPLIGYGAAPIIGFGIALGLNRIPKR
ncbi:MAG: hypothetical protein WBA68_12025 [Alteraurantiacibacter sp.]